MKHDIVCGILSIQASPKFLKIDGNCVNLQLVEPLTVLFSSGAQSVIYEISKPVKNAWHLGPSKSRKYLYLELGKNGRHKFVSSSFPPGLALGSPPNLPKRGQLYFDTVENIVREWTGNFWESKMLVYLGNVLGSFIEQAGVGDTYKIKKNRTSGRLLFNSDMDVIDIGAPYLLTSQRFTVSDIDIGQSDSTFLDIPYISKNDFIASCGIPKFALVGLLPNGLACIAGNSDVAAIGVALRSYSKGDTVIAYDGVAIPNRLGLSGRVYLGHNGTILKTPEASLFFQPVGFADSENIFIKIEKYEKYI